MDDFIVGGAGGPYGAGSFRSPLQKTDNQFKCRNTGTADEHHGSTLATNVAHPFEGYKARDDGKKDPSQSWLSLPAACA
jgi:hypothetical protein